MWIKNNPTPINSKINYLSNAHEFFFTFVKDKKPTFNSEYDNAIYRYPLCHGKERLEHATQKPLILIKQMIEKHSNPDDLVLDTFSGSGTVAEACLLTGRRFMCIERDEKYYQMSLERIKQLEINKI
jgi:DNA modification methylase